MTLGSNIMFLFLGGEYEYAEKEHATCFCPPKRKGIIPVGDIKNL